MNAKELSFGVEIETSIPYDACPVGGHNAGIQVPWLPEGWLADGDPRFTPAAAGWVASSFPPCSAARRGFCN